MFNHLNRILFVYLKQLGGVNATKNHLDWELFLENILIVILVKLYLMEYI